MHGRLRDGAADGFKDKGVGTDDIVGRGRARVGSRLHARRGAGVAVGASDDVTQDFCMAGTGLSLASSPKVATAGEQCEEDKYGKTEDRPV